MSIISNEEKMVAKKVGVTDEQWNSCTRRIGKRKCLINLNSDKFLYGLISVFIVLEAVNLFINIKTYLLVKRIMASLLLIQ
jgi:hypothetical protein